MKVRVIFLLCLLSSATMAQKKEGQSVAAFSLGNSLGITTLVDTLVGASYQPGEIDQSSSPVIFLSYDYKVSRRMAAGAALSFQTHNMKLSDPTGSFTTESAGVLTMYVGGRISFHYGKNEKVDWYHGFKLGVLRQYVYNHDVASPAFNTLNESLSMGRLAYGFIPFGVRWFVNDKIGINFETSLGVPMMLSAGINYRWGEEKE